MHESFPSGSREEPAAQSENFEQPEELEQTSSESEVTGHLPVEHERGEDAVDVYVDGPTQLDVAALDFDGAKESHVDNPSDAWDQAHDEKYTREGKTGLLERARTAEYGELSAYKPNTISDLYKAYLNGENVTVDFNGDSLNSREIGELGIDGAYEKYFGYDKEHYEEHVRLARAARTAEYDLKQFEAAYRAKKEIPKLVEESAELIKPEAGGEWRECLKTRATDLYHGADSKSAIEVMKAHSRGVSTEELKELLDSQGHSGSSYGMTMAIIKHFYREGDNLIEALQR